MRDLSDPISRQQTITALRALSDDNGYINAPHEVVTDVVRGLPPVQAEHEQTTHSEQTKKDKLGVKTSETYKDTISRQTLCEYALNQKDKSVTPNDIMRFPSAQPEREKGEWIPLISISDGKHHEWCGYQCSICGERTLRLMQYNFCPKCGADMREGQDAVN